MIKKSLLDNIKTKFGKGDIVNDSIIFNEIDLEFKILKLESTSQLTRIDFSLVLEKYNQDIKDTMLAIGYNEDDTIQKLAEQIITLILTPMFDTINSNELIEHCIYNDKSEFTTSKSDVVITGEVDGDISAKVYPDGAYDIIKDYIMEYIGFNKVYLVNMLIATTYVDTNVIVKVNGERIEKLSNILTQKAKSLDIKSIYYSEQQTFILRQKGETNMPFDYNLIKDTCFKVAMPLLEVATESNYESIFDNIQAEIGDENIARDIFLLVPEILCEIIFENSTEFEDKITLVDGDKLTEIRCIQLRLYSYIKTALTDYLIEFSPSREAILNAYSFSARYNCIAKALINQTDLSKLANISLALQVSKNHKIY